MSPIKHEKVVPQLDNQVIKLLMKSGTTFCYGTTCERGAPQLALGTQAARVHDQYILSSRYTVSLVQTVRRRFPAEHTLGCSLHARTCTQTSTRIDSWGNLKQQTKLSHAANWMLQAL